MMVTKQNLGMVASMCTEAPVPGASGGQPGASPAGNAKQALE
jgi:hypothetical protein